MLAGPTGPETTDSICLHPWLALPALGLTFSPPSSSPPLSLSLETRSHAVAQVGLELMIFLPQPPTCWDYRCVPPHQLQELLCHPRPHLAAHAVRDTLWEVLVQKPLQDTERTDDKEATADSFLLLATQL
jgi:hypothetical protein